MSLEILGNNSYKDVPLIDTLVGTWAEGVNGCDPLFRNLAAVGLSALYYGVERSPNTGSLADRLEFGELFDETGTFVGNALHRQIDDGWYPQPPHVEHFVAGVYVTTAALVASRLFKTLNVVNDDYVGQTGVQFIQRRVELPVPARNANDAGKAMNTYPVRNIQARVYTRQQPNGQNVQTELDLTAALMGAGSLPWSTSTTLRGSVESVKQSAEASVISGSRQGDIVKAELYSDFQQLGRYAKVVSDNLGTRL